MRVADVMSSPTYTCSPSEAVDRAAQLMWEHDIGVVPVVDHGGHAIAMITDRDICMAAYTQGRVLREIRVQQVMSRVVYTCHPEDKLTAAERTMRVHQVRRLPVVDDAGVLVGVLSVNDLCRARAESPLGGLTSDLVTTLAAIGEPHAQRVEAEQQERAIQPPTQRETDAAGGSPRMPPESIRDPTSLFRF